MIGQIKDGNLVLELPMQKPKKSMSGKTWIVASSHGVKQVTAKVEGESVYVSVNAFIYLPADTKSEEESEEPKGKGRHATPKPSSAKIKPTVIEDEEEFEDDDEN